MPCDDGVPRTHFYPSCETVAGAGFRYCPLGVRANALRTLRGEMRELAGRLLVRRQMRLL